MTRARRTVTPLGVAALVAAAAAVVAAQPGPDVDAGPADGGAPDAGPLIVDGPDLAGLARPQTSAAAAPSRVRLGDTLTLFVEVIYDEKVTVNLPATLELAPYFEETRRTSSDERRSDGTRKRTYQVQLRAWELGDLRIPPIPVGYTAGGQQSWVVTNTVPIEVHGSLGDVDDKTALLADTPPVALRSRDWRLPLAAAVGLAALAVALVVWRLRRRRRVPAPTVVLVRPAAVTVALGGPAERALAALAALERAGTLVTDPRAGYEEMVEIVRGFCGEQFGVATVDRTSDELLRALARPMPPATHGLARRWFARCDLVKYAAERPAPAAARGDLGSARELVIAAVTPAAAAAAEAAKAEAEAEAEAEAKAAAAAAAGVPAAGAEVRDG
ncbi:MAG: hypothetical protein KJZ91_00800 [Myxococcales bacterium]|nr:hypothetical protein [Myxococcales bacterium]